MSNNYEKLYNKCNIFYKAANAVGKSTSFEDFDKLLKMLEESGKLSPDATYEEFEELMQKLEKEEKELEE